jgi:hypothetical protein
MTVRTHGRPVPTYLRFAVISITQHGAGHIPDQRGTAARLARTPPGRATGNKALMALKQERDELAVQLKRIEAYQPGIREKAQACIAQVDRMPKRR